MSRKRYRETINPQIAVQDYLDDLLKQMPTTSVLDQLKATEEKKEAADAQEIAERTTKKRVNEKKYVQKSSERTSIKFDAQASSIAAYSSAPDKSLASQRLEKKRALARSPHKEFREPLILKTSPILGETFKIEPLKAEPISESHSQPKNDITTEKRHSEVLSETQTDKDLTADSSARIITTKTRIQPLPAVESEFLIQTAPKISADYIAAPSKSEALEPAKHWLTSGQPEWAQGRFECLIFTVAGLKLAVPLVSLGAIHTIDKELTPLVGMPSWFLGLLTVGERNVRVVDSARWIMPERHNESVKDNYKFVIRLNDSEWGMACDSVAQSFSLMPEEVRWRTNRGKRPWLAGTVIEHMCALMDVAAVSWLLDDAEKNRLSPI